MKEWGEPIVLFDGICNLCNASVQFILKYEKKPIFKFGTLQNEKVQTMLQKNYSAIPVTDSVLLIENDLLYQESTAALMIARKLKYFWILYYLIYLPAWLRNPFYRFVARNRYRWFGKRDNCMVPSDDLKRRFIQ